jgi:hypothetical protein
MELGNGARNVVFIVSLYLVLVAVDYMYTITDTVTGSLYNATNSTNPNAISDAAYSNYSTMRDLMYGGITLVLMPWLVFLSLASSAVNRHVSLSGYLVNSMIVVLLTPVVIYICAELITQMLSVSILDTGYMAQVWFDNFLYVLIANMLLSLASFVFVRSASLGDPNV